MLHQIVSNMVIYFYSFMKLWLASIGERHVQHGQEECSMYPLHRWDRRYRQEAGQGGLWRPERAGEHTEPAAGGDGRYVWRSWMSSWNWSCSWGWFKTTFSPSWSRSRSLLFLLLFFCLALAVWDWDLQLTISMTQNPTVDNTTFYIVISLLTPIKCDLSNATNHWHNTMYLVWVRRSPSSNQKH